MPHPWHDDFPRTKLRRSIKYIRFQSGELHLKATSHLTATLALLTGLSVLAAAPAFADVAANENVDGKALYVKPGSWIRYSDALVSRVYTTTKVTLEVKGRGTCTTRLCPITHNNTDLWALRSRLDIAKPAGDVIVVKERTLRAGDEGTDVKLAQEALNKNGAKIEADGKYGRTTVKAVQAFQEKSGLEADGDIGNATRLKLKI